MNKSRKYQIYQQNIRKQEYFLLDVVNFLLGLVIIVATILALLGIGGLLMHMVVFFLGGTLMLLNAIKNFRRKSLLAVTFTVFTLLMYGIFAYILYIYLRMG